MNFSKKFVVWFGIIGSVASLVSLLFIFLPLNQNIKIEVKTINIENLTVKNVKTEPELNVTYRYKGTEINNLWRYTISMTNTSNKTLVGIGNQKNIIKDTLTFKFLEDFEILDYKNIKSDFNHKLLIIDSLKIGLMFEQWRPNESIQYYFYIKANQNIPAQIPFGNSSYRQIVDGDCIFKYSVQESNNKNISNTLPPQITKVTSIISTILISLIIFLLIFIFIASPIAFYKRVIWHKNNMSTYTEFIQKEFQNEVSKEFYIKNPDRLADKYWENYKGPKYPNLNNDFNVKFVPFILIELLLIIGIFSLSLIIINLFYSLF